MIKYKYYRKIVLWLIMLSGILLYFNTLKYPEILFDGILFIINNPLIQDPDFYVKLFDLDEFSRLDEQFGLVSDVTTNFMMRPVAYLTFTFNYIIGDFNPISYRLINIAVHIINSLLVYVCIERCLDYTEPEKSSIKFSAQFIPAASAFVFLLHPMQTESVTYIVQRFASLAALFYLLTIWLYLVWAKQRGKWNEYARWASLVAMSLGMLTRESLFTAPVLIVLLEVTILGNNMKDALRRAAPHLMLLPLVPILVISVSAAQNNSSASFLGAINIVNYESIPIVHYALTQLVVIVTYLRLYLLPYGQNVDHDFPLYTLPTQWPVVCSGTLILLMLGGAFFLYRKNMDDVRCKLVLVGICWYFLGLTVSSSLIPLPDLMVEHRAYFSSIGIIIALVCLLDVLRSFCGSVRSERLLVAAITVFCLILIVFTYNRNSVWQSEIQLWSDSVKKSPAKHRAVYNLGVAYAKAGKYSEALKHLHKSTEINPAWSQAYEVLAKSYIELKSYHEAIDVCLKGANVDPANPVHYNYLGIAYAELNRYDDAKRAFSTAIALDPGFENAVINLDQIKPLI